MNHTDSTLLPSPSRRNFLKTSAASAAGLVVAFHIPFNDAMAQVGPSPEINAWVVVKPDDTIIIRIVRCEMGQGTLTGLAQLVAEELEADWARVTTEFPTAGQNLARNRIWGDFDTDTSKGIRNSQDYVRKGGAGARMMLLQAAANEWKVPVTECRASKSIITHTPSGRKTSYGKVAEAAGKLPPPTDIPLKDPKNWTIAGKRIARLDTVAKTTGAKIYGMDLKMPGMVLASIKACPYYGGKVKSFDAKAIEKRPGIKKVIQVGDNAVAVVADTWWHANTALNALPIVWDKGPNPNISTADLDAMLKEGLSANDVNVGNKKGDVQEAFSKSARKIEAVYAYPNQAHATMETRNATAVWTPEGCQCSTGSQDPENALKAIAAVAGLPLEKCEVINIPPGGGFGLRGVHDCPKQAMEIAKSMPGVPVKLIWSREEDFTQGHYHPSTQCKMVASLDDKGEITGLHMRISGQSILHNLVPEIAKGGKDPVMFQGLDESGLWAIGYTFPNLLVDHAKRGMDISKLWFWRAVMLNQNSIYLESFIDEIAHATKQDPLALRRKLMVNHPKNLAVLNTVAEKINWNKKPEKGRFRGLAQYTGFGTYVAACAEISLKKDGKVKVHRVVVAIDPGHAVNPQQIEAQVEGSFAFSLTAAMYGGVTLKDGQIEQNNFGNYPILKMDEMPKVETTVMPSGGPWGGVGEPSGAVAVPAVLNAIFAATGKRVRTLPLKNHNLKKAS